MCLQLKGLLLRVMAKLEDREGGQAVKNSADITMLVFLSTVLKTGARGRNRHVHCVLVH